jgi:hypothetical protein
MRVSLNENGTVKLDGSGNGTARVGPIGHGVTWILRTAAVKANTRVKEAICNIYVGNLPTADNFADATYTGSSGNASDAVSGMEVRQNSYVWAVWTGGDAGSQATVTVTGEIEIG